MTNGSSPSLIRWSGPQRGSSPTTGGNALFSSLVSLLSSASLVLELLAEEAVNVLEGALVFRRAVAVASRLEEAVAGADVAVGHEARPEDRLRHRDHPVDALVVLAEDAEH